MSLRLPPFDKIRHFWHFLRIGKRRNWTRLPSTCKQGKINRIEKTWVWKFLSRYKLWDGVNNDENKWCLRPNATTTNSEKQQFPTPKVHAWDGAEQIICNLKDPPGSCVQTLCPKTMVFTVGGHAWDAAAESVFNRFEMNGGSSCGGIPHSINQTWPTSSRHKNPILQNTNLESFVSSCHQIRFLLRIWCYLQRSLSEKEGMLLLLLVKLHHFLLSWSVH